MKKPRIGLPVLKFCITLILASTPLAAAVEWVDMGPLQGTGNGHVWSKVVDEVGNIVGRNEIWSVKLPAPAVVEVIVKCPIPSQLGVTVKWKSEYGDALEWGVEQTGSGFYHKFSDPWSPATQKEIKIVVATRAATSDQVYQLICNLYDASGRLISQPVATHDPMDKPVENPRSGNVAVGKPASQSSTYVGTGVDQGAHHAVDGKTDGRDPHDLMITALENNPWWQVDLQQVYDLRLVRLFNRHNALALGNCKSFQLQLSLDGKLWNTVYRHDSSGWEKLDIPVSGKARFVRLQLTERGIIALYEVEVYSR
jgi:hypothetical protein